MTGNAGRGWVVLRAYRRAGMVSPLVLKREAMLLKFVEKEPVSPGARDRKSAAISSTLTVPVWDRIAVAGA